MACVWVYGYLCGGGYYIEPEEEIEKLIDYIGISRGNDSGCDDELVRTTIALMQVLDGLTDGQIIIAATDRIDRLYKALIRRFQRSSEFKAYEVKERELIIKTYISNENEEFLTDDVIAQAENPHTQF